jgi:peptidoglycan hydrolase-like protein with peptidoglycan-binding domain
MGEPLKEDIANQGFWNTIKSVISQPKASHYKKIPNAIDGTDLVDTQARDKILGYIKTQLAKNSTPPDNGGDDNTTTPPDNNDTNTTNPDPTQDPNKVCVSNYFQYYGDGKIHDSLKKGDKDAQTYSDGTKHQVQELQEFLQAFGYDVGSSGADGWFGSDTKDALVAFQDNNGLEADGIVGPNTRDTMNAANCYDK